MSPEEEEPLIVREERYQRIIQKKYYIEDKEKKGETPLSERIRREEFSSTLSQAMHELKEEI